MAKRFCFAVAKSDFTDFKSMAAAVRACESVGAKLIHRLCVSAMAVDNIFGYNAPICSKSCLSNQQFIEINNLFVYPLHHDPSRILAAVPAFAAHRIKRATVQTGDCSADRGRRKRRMGGVCEKPFYCQYAAQPICCQAGRDSKKNCT